MVVASFIGHEEGAYSAGVGPVDDEDVVFDSVTDSLGIDALIAARAGNAVDDIVGNREIIDRIIEIDAALYVELIVSHVVNKVMVDSVVPAWPP